MKTGLPKWLLVVGGAVVVVIGLFLLIQLVPMDYTNPPVVAEPAWDSAQTRTLAQRACFDCHSNETVWPLYSRIAPISWLVVHDVDEGREHLNFSEWTGATRGRENPADEAGEKIAEGEMPPASYLWMHPDARLTDAEKQQLIDGLNASLR